jgi:hypothetical protein
MLNSKLQHSKYCAVHDAWDVDMRAKHRMALWMLVHANREDTSKSCTESAMSENEKRKGIEPEIRAFCCSEYYFLNNPINMELSSVTYFR